MPMVYIFCGVPASGKSTFALEHFPELQIVSSDDILEKEAQERGLTYDEYFAEGISAADKKFFKIIEDNLDQGKSFVVDRVNLSKKSRAKIINKIPNEYKIIGICFETPEEKEWERRLNSRPGKTINKNIIDNMLKSATLPSYEEGFDEIYWNYEF